MASGIKSAGRKKKVISPLAEAITPQLQQAFVAIEQVFGKSQAIKDPKLPKQLRHTLEKLLCKREEWDYQLTRRLSDKLLEGMKHRRRSAEHERVWFNLTGYCLRPGFGDALDQARVQSVWPLYISGLQFSQEAQNWAEWWTFWRRIAGGLVPEQQQQIYLSVTRFIDPVNIRNRSIAAELKNRAYEFLIRCVALLEHLSIEQKTQLGEWLLTRLKNSSEPLTSWWALGRIAARVPSYANRDQQIPFSTVSVWLKTLLAQDLRKDRALLLAATLMAQRTGDALTDIDDALRQQVLKQLVLAKAPVSWIQLVEVGGEVNAQDQNSLLGETLPRGLRLLNRVL